MNTLPEWFTVEPDKSDTVRDLTAGPVGTFTGRQLHAGLTVRLNPGAERRRLVAP